MTYQDLYEKAAFDLEQNKITLGEFEERIKPLKAEIRQWIPVSERLPEETGEYLTTTMYGDVFCDRWQSCNFDRTEIVIAWMSLPEPYRGDEQNDR